MEHTAAIPSAQSTASQMLSPAGLPSQRGRIALTTIVNGFTSAKARRTEGMKRTARRPTR